MANLEEKITTNDREIANNHPDIIGWGIDADPENYPNYPMKKWDGSDHERLQYKKAPQQKTEVEVLKSTERPTYSRVFGTTVPPSGVSGMIRRFAFRFSEGNAIHWFSLVLADRINVIEGIIHDLARGIVPNIWVERGWSAEWKYNRKGMVKKIAVTTVVAAAVITYLLLRSNRKKQMRLIS